MSRNTYAQAINVNNIGLFDRIARGVFAAAMLAPAYLDVTASSLGWMSTMLLLSAYPAITALAGWDPFYEALNVTTKGSVAAEAPGTPTVEELLARYKIVSIGNKAPAQQVQDNKDSSQQQRAA